MIDLHTHTVFSDGTWTLEEMLTNAENANINILSITDHDTALPHIKLKDIDIKKFFSGRVVVGGEFNAIFKNKKIELLGYNFNPVQLQKWIDNTYNKKNEIQEYEEEFLELLELCKKNGIKTSDGLKYDKTLKYPTKIIYNDIIKYKENKRFFTDDEWNVRESFFRSCTCNPNFILYRSFSKQYPSAKEVATQIRKHGGKVFIAHLYLYQLDNHIEYLEYLVKDKIIDGVEVYYSGFNVEQMEELKEFCNKHRLLMSGGTDCHGMRKPIKLGVGIGNMNISEDVVKDWI